MSTRMILSIAFVFFVVLGMIVYVLYDNSRADTTTKNSIEAEAAAGAELFGANCSQCHGPKGEGAIGPAVDRPEWHAGDPKYDENSVTTFIRNVLQRGQYSPQPGINMPAWAREYGGPFNDQQIDQLIIFITHPGNWDEPLKHTAAPNFLADIPPNADMKKQSPQTVADALVQRDSAKYGGTTPNADQKKLLSEDAKKEDDAKGPIYQQVQANKEKVRLILGNRDPNNPGEKLNGIKQLLQVKGCINCHAFGSAGSTLGPALTEVGSRRTQEWLTNWIKNPAAVTNDQRGPNLLPYFKDEKRTEFWPMQPTFMPKIEMTDDERKTIVDYIFGLKTPEVALPQPNQQTPTK